MEWEERKRIQMAYIRVCRDANFNFDQFRAAHFTANLLGIHPFEVLTAFGHMDNMETVAKGLHPIIHNPEFDNRRTKVKNEL